MPKLIGVDEWVKQINLMIDRLSTVNCDKCLPEFMERMVGSGTISKWAFNDDFVIYTIEGKEYKKEL